jgi:hypothetical protein
MSSSSCPLCPHVEAHVVDDGGNSTVEPRAAVIAAQTCRIDMYSKREREREAELRGRRMDRGERTSVDGNGGTWAPVIFIAWIMLSMLR